VFFFPRVHANPQFLMHDDNRGDDSRPDDRLCCFVAFSTRSCVHSPLTPRNDILALLILAPCSIGSLCVACHCSSAVWMIFTKLMRTTPRSKEDEREREREREREGGAAPTWAMEMAATCSHLLIGRAAKPSVYVRAYFPLAAPATP